jgi:hypothetical protein
MIFTKNTLPTTFSQPKKSSKNRSIIIFHHASLCTRHKHTLETLYSPETPRERDESLCWRCVSLNQQSVDPHVGAKRHTHVIDAPNRRTVFMPVKSTQNHRKCSNQGSKTRSQLATLRISRRYISNCHVTSENDVISENEISVMENCIQCRQIMIPWK